MAAGKPSTRLLIANRGEIARRVIRSAHSMGISTVAVYADPDADAPYVSEADQAVALEGRSSAETHLDIDKVLDAAKLANADAVHPGYGFLSENADFARAVEDAGMTWVGPTPEAIEKMGDKISARKVMARAGAPTLPAAEIPAGDDLSAAAREVGYPLLVKASAGGGGKGMRVVRSESDLRDAVASAQREASAAFGNDTVYFERWLETCRHVEVQVLGDKHGNLIHCFERECSIQRRRQKIIEEAPSPAVTPAIRERLVSVALAAARAIDYESAGTVEFLLDGENVWFLEMNTRLQVEHPVTEEITGLDLVREQLRVAQGETLSVTQSDLAVNGHAIEARIYAEDPANNFLPTPGTVEIWEPSQGARFESGVESGSVVGVEFDPMLAKVIVHAPTRREAGLRLARVLESTRIQGITTNRDFLVSTLRTPAFLSGDTTTDFVERIAPRPRREIGKDELAGSAIAVTMMAQALRRDQATSLKTIPSGWRNTKMPPESVTFKHRDEEITVNYRIARDGAFDVTVDDRALRVSLHSRDDDKIEITIDGRRNTRHVVARGNRWLVHGNAGDIELVELPRFPVAEADVVSGGLVAPMPGKVTSIHVSVGDEVEKGRLLFTLEAMKMENHITAPFAGAVAEIHAAEGNQVANGQLLIVLAEA